MIIEIESIDRSHAVRIGAIPILGYRGRFKSDLVSGAAILVPETGKEDRLVPASIISVETGQESVSDFKTVPSDIDSSMDALAEPGDYRVVGTVVFNAGDQIFEIDVGDCPFTLDVEETAGVIPIVGERVSFVVHGLSLWDDTTIGKGV